MTKQIIYLDMDGVVADFNQYVGQLLNREIGWEGRDLSDEEWKVVSSHDNLYFKLPLIKESKKLVEAAAGTGLLVMFLTAIPRRTTMPTAESDKRKWLDVHFPFYPVAFGPYSKDKQKWAQPLDILVDDKKSNVEEWKEAGGIAIHHLGDYNKTIQNLKVALTICKPVILK